MSWRCQQPEVIRTASIVDHTHGEKGRGRMVIPCGQCLGCETKWRKGWVLRMMLEADSSGPALFVTLTYQDTADRTSLVYNDVASYLKRLRKNTQRVVRFFCSGEYGETYGRPHWHLILFGLSDGTIPVGLSHMKEWPHGGTLVAPANPATMAYVAGYSLKKRLGGMHVEMSRKPGLGLVRCYELGEEMARQIGEVDVFPSAIRVGRHLYPLHRRARDVMQQSYVEANGIIRRIGRTGVSMEAESILALKSGQWRSQSVAVEKAFSAEYIRNLEKSYGKAKPAA